MGIFSRPKAPPLVDNEEKNKEEIAKARAQRLKRLQSRSANGGLLGGSLGTDNLSTNNLLGGGK